MPMRPSATSRRIVRSDEDHRVNDYKLIEEWSGVGRSPSGRRSRPEIAGDSRTEGPRRGRPASVYLPIVVHEATGAWSRDVDGNSFLDFTGGVGCLNVGHARPRRRGGAEQLARFTHTDFTILPYESYVALAERLVELRSDPGRRGRRSSTRVRRRSRTRSRSPASRRDDRRSSPSTARFHGRTLMAMRLTSKTHPYKAGLGPSRPRSTACRFADTRTAGPRGRGARASSSGRCTLGSPPRRSRRSSSSPCRARAASCVPPDEFVRGLRRDLRRARHRARRRRGADRLRPHRPLVRDGALRRRARPDDRRQVDRRRVAALRRASVAPSSWTRRPDSAIGGTFPGNPVACAAALAVLDVIEEEHLVERAEAVGAEIRSRMERLARALPGGRRRARAGSDAGDRARPGSRHEGARSRARHGDRRGRGELAACSC